MNYIFRGGGEWGLEVNGAQSKNSLAKFLESSKQNLH